MIAETTFFRGYIIALLSKYDRLWNPTKTGKGGLEARIGTGSITPTKIMSMLLTPSSCAH